MNVNRENTEIVTTRPLYFAEGTSINFGKQYEPKEVEIQNLLLAEGWRCDEIDIFYDDFQCIWRWSCNIERAS